MRLLLLLGTTLMCAATASASPLPEYPFVFTTGSAKADVPPDVVELSFSLSAHNANEVEALKAVQRGFQRVLEILAAADVKEADIDASSVDKSEQRHWDEDKDISMPDGFDVTRTFTVTVRDLVKYPVMGKALLDLPGTSEFDPTFNRTDRLKIESELFQRAAQDAKARAERMATSFERKLGPVRAIAQIPFGDVSNWLGVGGDQRYLSDFTVTGSRRSTAEPDSLLVPAIISISAQVNVVFELQ
jgi:uncharacterized protein YggE